MITEIPLDIPGLFAFKISGTLTEHDAVTFLPRLEALASQNKPLSLLIRFESFHGWDPKVILDDIRFARHHARDFRRIAILGENRWEHWMTGLAKLFLYANVKYFDGDEEDVALGWLQETSGGQGCRPKRYQHLLVATENSAVDACFIWRGAELASFYGAKMTVMHIVPPGVDYYGEYSPFLEPSTTLTDDPVMASIEDQLLGQAQQNLDTFLAEVLSDDHMALLPEDVITEVRIGYVHGELLLYAERNNVDLIVMGTRKHRGLGRLAGSTSSAILNTAKCDVLELRIN